MGDALRRAIMYIARDAAALAVNRDLRLLRVILEIRAQ